MRGRWKLTDGQVHVWAASTKERPWPADAIAPQREMPFGVDELSREMERCGVDRCILVPPTWDGMRNDIALAAAHREPGRFAVMGRLDVRKPENVQALATWRDDPCMLGLRLSFNRGDKAAQLQRAADDGFFAAAESGDVSIMIYAPGLMPHVAAIAERHPRLRFIIDHLALDDPDRGKDLRALTQPVHPLARLPNVAVKVSALPCYIDEAFPFPSLRPLVYDMVSSFGAARVFWGSDLSRLPCKYDDLVNFFVEDLKELNDEERGLVLGEGIRSWLNWQT